MKKIIALFLCLATAAFAASCSLFRPPVSSESESGTGKETSSTGEDLQPADLLREAQGRIDVYRELDFAGKTLTVVCPRETVDVYQPTETGSSLAGARVLRNVNAAGAVGAELKIMYTRGDVSAELRTTADSGDLYADLVSLPQNRIGVLAKGGYLQNLVELPYAAIRGDNYNNTAYSPSSQIYGVYGDFNFDPSYLYCVYYNAALCRDRGADVRSLYAEGKWNVEEFLKILRALDGSLGEKEYGFAWASAELGSENRIADLVFSASGLKYLRAEGSAFADVLSPAAEEAVSAAREMISLRRLSVTDMIYGEDAFTGGALCFCCDTLDYSLSIPASLEWGVLPIPSSDGSVGTLLPATAGMLCMPKSAPTEACGAFLGAFAAFSCGYIPSMFLRDVFAASARSSSALSVMKEIIASSVCDLAFIEAPAYVYVAAASYGAVRTAVKSGRTVAEIAEGLTAQANAELGR